jgi:Flp pilus assembly protein CpaB
MRSRGLVVALAVLLALAAAAAVILYTGGVKKAAESGGDLQSVIVATQDIPANTQLDPLIDGGAFKELNVPVDAVVDGAITSLAALRGETVTMPLVANQQVATSSLSSGEQVQGGALGISKGHVAVTIQVSDPQGVNGNIQRGDNVTVFATYKGIKEIKATAAQLVNPSAAASSETQDLPDFTVALIPTVRVLDVRNPIVDTTGSTTSTGTNNMVTLTLDLTPADAQNLVFAQESGLLWIGLLPPGEQGVQLPASQVPVKLLVGKLAA